MHVDGVGGFARPEERTAENVQAEVMGLPLRVLVGARGGQEGQLQGREESRESWRGRFVLPVHAHPVVPRELPRHTVHSQNKQAGIWHPRESPSQVLFLH